MRKKEQRLWDRMRRALNGRVRLERVENVVTVGMPDVMALANGMVTWLELKAVDNYPARESTRVLGNAGLSQDQKNWHKDWARWGGVSLIVIAVEQDTFVIPGRAGDEVNEFTQQELREYNLAIDWDELFVVLGGSL